MTGLEKGHLKKWLPLCSSPFFLATETQFYLKACSPLKHVFQQRALHKSVTLVILFHEGKRNHTHPFPFMTSLNLESNMVRFWLVEGTGVLQGCWEWALRETFPTTQRNHFQLRLREETNTDILVAILDGLGD